LRLAAVFSGRKEVRSGSGAVQQLGVMQTTGPPWNSLERQNVVEVMLDPSLLKEVDCSEKTMVYCFYFCFIFCFYLFIYLFAVLGCELRAYTMSTPPALFW
jgi:hypothetical protein